MDTPIYLRRRHQVLVIGHRGASGHAPENTLPSYRLALEQGAEILELDIHATRDGVLVVSHDPDVTRMAGAEGLIRDLTLAELKQLDAGFAFTPDEGRSFPYRGQGVTIPTLEEVFAAFPGVRMNVDIKHHAPAVVDALVRMIRVFGREALLMVGSFDDATIAAFRAALPEVLTAASLSETRRAYALGRVWLGWLHRPVAAAYQIPEHAQGRHIVTPSFIRQVHAAGREVHVWTVNDLADMRRLINWGVDGIITDFPDRLIGTLNRER